MTDGYSVKAATARELRVKSGFVIAVVSAVVLAGIYLIVYNCIAGSPLFCAAYAVAVILGIDYIVMKVSTVFATYISIEDGYIYVKNWDNDFFPYDVKSCFKAIREFLPAKTRIFEIPVSEVTALAVGTKNYIIKLFPDDERFIRKITQCEKDAGSGQRRYLKTTDFLYIQTVNKKSIVIGISRYDADSLVKLIKTVKRENPAASVMLNSREFRILRMRKK